MKKYKYYFHIVDVEFGTSYDWTAVFDDHMEADRFITENEVVGNLVKMRAPFFEEVLV